MAINVSEQVSGLAEFGTDLGGFMTNLAPGLGALIIIMAIFGGLGAIIYAVASLIKKKIGGSGR